MFELHYALDFINQINANCEKVLELKGELDSLFEKEKKNSEKEAKKLVLELKRSLESYIENNISPFSKRFDDIIDSSRGKLKNIFDNAVIKCDEKVQQILPQLTVERGQHKRVSVKTTTKEEVETKKAGLFGWKKENIHLQVTENTVDTSSVIENIEMYSAKCHSYVNSEFKNIFNKEKFAQDIKEVVLNAFNKSQKEFDENDILLPLENVLDKISVPHIKFDYTPYIDEVETRFKKGYAKDEEIHKLTILQSRLLNAIEDEIDKQLHDVLKDITKTLKTQAVLFADQIENEFCGELEKLKGQAEERERYIKEYEDFTKMLKDMKAKM